MNYKFLFLSLIFFTQAFSQTRLDNATIEEYLKIQNEFRTELCTPGTEENFLKLSKEYQGDGNYIPTQLDEKIDLKAVKSIIPLIDLKYSWLLSQSEKVKQYSDFQEQLKLLQAIKSQADLLQTLKKDYFKSKDQDKDKKREEAKKLFTTMVSTVDDFKSKIPFLLSFKFPVNHLALRAEYEKIKDTNDKEKRARANLIFFFRKVVQDGSLDEDGLKSDANLRATFDTWYLSLKLENKDPERFFLTDNERVDLNYLVKAFENLLKQKPEKIQRRMIDWAERVGRSKEFYLNLLENKKIKISENSELRDITSVLENRARALYNLKEFVLKNEAKTYEYWTKKSDLFQSLFVLETILYSEVGRTDENVNFFRQDVAQVVYNRLKDPKFNQFSSNDPLLKYLNKEVKTSNFPWLNVLFKEGEFSFTYFYIPGNLQIYCPDMSHVGKYLRKENLKIAMRILGEPRNDFKGIRYFSRISMFGRIAMDSVWNDFKAVDENPGIEVKKHAQKIKEAYSQQNYHYRYSFKGSDSREYDVVEIRGTHYVIDQKSPDKIYTYRNPHLFKFFSYTK